jgi:hypothetical protein
MTTTPSKNERYIFKFLLYDIIKLQDFQAKALPQRHEAAERMERKRAQFLIFIFSSLPAASLWQFIHLAFSTSGREKTSAGSVLRPGALSLISVVW